jgi:hypothetical protein
MDSTFVVKLIALALIVIAFLGVVIISPKLWGVGPGQAGTSGAEGAPGQEGKSKKASGQAA